MISLNIIPLFTKKSYSELFECKIKHTLMSINYIIYKYNDFIETCSIKKIHPNPNLIF